MNRFSVLGIGLTLLLLGGGFNIGLQLAGFETPTAQWWTSLGLLAGLLVWVGSYVSRVLTGSMAFHEQRKTYSREVIKQHLETLSPEELAVLANDLEVDPINPPAKASSDIGSSTSEFNHL